MKKLLIYLFLNILCFSSFGQGTAYITKSPVCGYSKMIRQYKQYPGYHVVYFTDSILDNKGYIGITDVYNNIKYIQICQDCTIKDIEVLDDYAFFCGQTSTNNGVLGWVDLYTMTVTIDSSSRFASFFMDNIEAYKDVAANNIHIVGYGTTTSGYVGFDYNIQTNSFRYCQLQYLPRDITLTDNFFVFAGDLSNIGSNNKIVIQPFPKNVTFPLAYSPYYTYTVGTPLVNEPYNNHLKVVNIGDDAVATLTHNLDIANGIYGMVIRKFDVSHAFINYSIPMTASYQAKYNYSIGDFYDFRYDVTSMTYLVFQNYEVATSSFQDVVTKINFSSGIPTTVSSDYLALSYQVMKSMSLSDGAKYVVYGYDAYSKANMFWKDFQNTAVLGTCLSSDVLPFNVISGIPENVIGASYLPIPIIPSLNSNSAYPISERIFTICH